MVKTLKKITVILCAFIFAVSSIPFGMKRAEAATVTPHFEFKIDGIQVNVTAAGAASTSYSTVYDGTQKRPVVSDVVYIGTDGKKSSVLSGEGDEADYVVSYGDNKNADNGSSKGGSVTITGKVATYVGTSTTVSFSITKAVPMINLTGDSSVTKTYDGTSVTLSSGTDFKVSPGLLNTNVTYSNLKPGQTAPVDAGSYTATIKATVPEADKGNYTTTSVTQTVSIQINPVDMEAAEVTLAGGNTQSYTGSQIKPAVTSVTLKGRALKPGTDYSTSFRYASNSAAGSTGYVYVDAKNGSNYTGTATGSFKISDAVANSIADATVTINGIKDGQKAEYAYTGNPIKPSVTVKMGTKTLSSADYSVSYSNNVSVGTATITVTGKGNYSPATHVCKEFTIKANEITSASIQAIPDQEYTGNAIEPKVTITVGGKTVSSDYYTVTYRSNTEVGKNTAVVTVTAKPDSQGNVRYTGRGEKTFTIKAHTIGSDDVEISPEVSYTGSNVRPAVIKVYKDADSNILLAEGTDYTVSCSNNVSVGNAVCTVKGIGPRYTGTVSKTFKIVAGTGNIDISSAVIRDIADQTYTGKVIKPGISVTFNGLGLSSSNYDVKYFSNINAGQASVYIYGKGKYRGSVSKTFLIHPASISSASVSGLPAQKYSGYALEPIPTAVTFNGKTLAAGKDYTLGYEKNVNKGTGYVILYGTGNFTGSKKIAFTITDSPEKETVWADGFTINDSYTVGSEGRVTLTPATSPSNANKYRIRWSTSNTDFVFIDGSATNTAQTTDSTGAVVQAPVKGNTTITATMYDENGKEIGTQYALIRVVKEFRDVKNGYYKTAVDTLANYGYMTGTGSMREFHSTPIIHGISANIFNPGGDVKRCDYILMLYNKAAADYASGKTSVNPVQSASTVFSDVSPSAYYAGAVSWAASNGIAFGKGEGIFDPNGTVTRAEAVTFLQRFVKGSSASTMKFNDVPFRSYYAGAVGWAVSNGVTSGTTAYTFSPNRNCSRAEAAAFIFRATK